MGNEPRVLFQGMTGAGTIKLRALNTGHMIADQRDIFQSYIDREIINSSQVKISRATPETWVIYTKMRGSNNFRQMFEGVPGGYGSKCLTQSQVAEFCRNLPAEIIESRGIVIFLCKKNEFEGVEERHPEKNTFVALIDVGREKLPVYHNEIIYKRSLCGYPIYIVYPYQSR